MNRTPTKNKNDESRHSPHKDTNDEVGKMNDNETCPISNCNRLFKDDQEGIQCDLCDNWFHIKCVKISKEEYRIQK